MLFSSSAIFLTLATLLSLGVASPIASLDTRAVPANYTLRTKVVNGTGDLGSKKGGLYVTAWHTGAGFNDAVLLNDSSTAAKGYLNDTYQQFNLGSEFPWYFAMGSDTNYAGEFLDTTAGESRLSSFPLPPPILS